jgi:hypothetical protein
MAHPLAADFVTGKPRRSGILAGYKADKRLLVWVCERVVYLFNFCERVNFVTTAGYNVPTRADEIRPLSCTTLRSSRLVILLAKSVYVLYNDAWQARAKRIPR